MMRRCDSAFENATCVVPLGASLDGTLEASGPHVLRIDGRFSGTVRLADGRLFIGPGAEVARAKVDAASLVVLGNASGTFRTKELVIGPEAQIEGHVEYSGSMECALGACVNAQVSRVGQSSTIGQPTLDAIS